MPFRGTLEAWAQGNLPGLRPHRIGLAIVGGSHLSLEVVRLTCDITELNKNTGIAHA